MKYFNDFIILGKSYQILYRKPTFKEIYNMIINEQKNLTLINESVFKTCIFQDLFKHIKNNNKNIQWFNTEMLKDYFPINSKIFKILSKNKDKDFFKLYIVQQNFNDKTLLKQVLDKVCGYDISQENVNFMYNELKNASGLFTSPINNKEFGILWLHKNKSNILDFKHEFIHYLEWICGLYKKNININIDLNNNEYFQNQILFRNIFNLSEEHLKYIFNKKEYQTLLNDYLNLLEQIKKEYFSNLSGYDFAKKITFDLRKNGDNKFYLNKIKNIQYYKKYLNTFPLAMIIGYHCLDYQTTNIKNHIFGRFNED